MAVSRVYPHTATLWCRAGEDGGRKALWRLRVLDGVRWTEKRARSGEAVQDEVHLLIPNVFSGYVAAEDLAAGKALGGDQWTLARGDRIILGAQYGPKPPNASLSIEAVRSIMRGVRVDHFEVVAK